MTRKSVFVLLAAAVVSGACAQESALPEPPAVDSIGRKVSPIEAVPCGDAEVCSGTTPVNPACFVVLDSARFRREAAQTFRVPQPGRPSLLTLSVQLLEAPQPDSGSEAIVEVQQVLGDTFTYDEARTVAMGRMPIAALPLRQNVALSTALVSEPGFELVPSINGQPVSYALVVRLEGERGGAIALGCHEESIYEDGEALTRQRRRISAEAFNEVPFIRDRRDMTFALDLVGEGQGGGDPCAVDNGGCDENATCTQVGTAAQCECSPGWVGNGYSCEQDLTLTSPTGLEAAGGVRQITLTWSPVPGASGYTVWRALDEEGPYAQVSPTLGTASWVDTGRDDAATYWYQVRAHKPGVTSEPSAPVSGLTVPAAPAGLAASASEEGILLTWDAVPGAERYQVWRQTAQGAVFVAVVTGTTEYLDEAPAPGTVATYYVEAGNESGWSDPSDTASAVTRPAAPSDVVAVAEDTTITVSWSAVQGAVGYRVYSKYDPDADFELRTVPFQTELEFVDETLGRAAWGYYVVEALNATGTSDQSSVAAAVTAPDAVPLLTAYQTELQATLQWQAAPEALDYVVYRAALPDGPFAPIATTGATQLVDLAPGWEVERYYAVVARNAAGDAPWSDVAFAVLVLLPDAPTGLTVRRGNGSLTLRWVPPEDTGGVPIIEYVVRVTPVAGGDTVERLVRGSVPPPTTATVTGLTNGVEYEVTVAARTAVGEGDESEPVRMAPGGTNPTAPSAPAMPVAVPGNGEITVSWTAPVDNGATILYYTVTPNPLTTCGRETTAFGTSMTFRGLTNGTACRYQVAATNSVGKGAASALSVAVTPVGPPAVPPSVSASLDAGKLKVTWGLPATGGSAITHFVIRVVSTGERVEVPLTPRSYTFGTLPRGPQSFQVAAVNEHGEGPFSAPTNSLHAADVPGAPAAPAAVSVAPGSARVTWTAPADDGGSPILRYVVQAWAGDDVVASVEANEVRPTTVSGLTAPGQAYRFTVLAANASGEGPASAPSAPMSWNITAPAAPVALRTIAGTSLAVVEWTPSAHDGGSPVTGYVVRATYNNNPAYDVSSAAPASATSATLSPLNNNWEYTVQVFAKNAIGESPASNALTVRPLASLAVPTVPTEEPGLGGLKRSDTDPMTIEVWWKPVTNALDYIVTAVPASGEAIVADGVAGPSHSVTGFTVAVPYRFTVVARNGLVTSAPLELGPMTPVDRPGAPTGVSAVASPGGVWGDGAATVSWTAPGYTGGIPLSAFSVRAYEGATLVSTTVAGPTATSAEVRGLSADKTYVFRVAAVNAGATGPESASSADVTPVTAPGTPLGGAAAAADRAVTLSWTPPVHDGGSPVTGYVVSGLRVGTTTPTFTCTPEPATATSCTVTGLANNTNYEFHVRATNEHGTSAGLLVAARPVGEPAVPGRPNGSTAPALVVRHQTSEHWGATISWAAPSDGGSPILDYLVTATNASDTGAPYTWVVSGSPARFMGLNNNVTAAYSVTVQARNAVGLSIPSVALSLARGAINPDPPRLVRIVRGVGTATVSWQPPEHDGGAPITRYIVTSSTAGFSCVPEPLTATTCTATLPTNVTFTSIGVEAENALGEKSTKALASPATVLANAEPVAPNVPALSVSTYPTTSSATLSLGNPGNGGATLETYEIYLEDQLVETLEAPLASSLYTLTGLPTSGPALTAHIVVTNAAGLSTASVPVTVVRPPVPPTDVYAVPAGNGQLRVFWTASAEHGGAAPSYTVVGSPTGTCSGSASNQTNPNCYVGSLTNGTPYTFMVRATNVAGASELSLPSESAVPSALPAVVGVSAQVVTLYGGAWNEGRASLYWTSTTDFGRPVTSWVVTPYISTTPRHDLAVTVSAPPTAENPLVIGGLTGGTAYTFRVKASNRLGPDSLPEYGAETASNSVTPRTVPNAPARPTITRHATTGNITVSWVAPLHGGVAISAYDVQIDPPGPTCLPATPTTLNCAFTGHEPDTTYTVRVAASNTHGQGVYSAPLSFVGSTLPSAPTITSVALTSSTSYPNGGRAYVYFAPPEDTGGCPITNYRLHRWENGTTLTTTTPAAPGSTALNFLNTGLKGGASYTYAVEAFNCVGWGPSSAVSAPLVGATQPEPPATVTTAQIAAPSGDAYDNGRLLVSWTAPANDGGRPVTGYVITTNPVTRTIEVDETVSSTTLFGLSTITQYTVYVAAKNEIAAGTRRNGALLYPATVPTVTAAPTVATLDTGLQVSWSAIAAPYNGNSNILQYDVTARRVSDNSVVGTCTPATVAVRNCDLPELPLGELIAVTVTATNAHGTSLPSPATLRTVATYPGEPEGVVATADLSQSAAYTKGRVAVSWLAPLDDGNCPVTNYRVSAWKAGVEVASATLNAFSHTFANLTGGETYSFKVQAANCLGTANWGPFSAPSNPVMPITQPAAPERPVAVGLVGGEQNQGRVRVTWTPPADGGSPITAYKVMRFSSTAVTGTPLELHVVGPDVLEHVFENLSGSANHYFSVVAGNETMPNSTAPNFDEATGRSPASLVVNPITLPTAPVVHPTTGLSRTSGTMSLRYTPGNNGGDKTAMTYAIYAGDMHVTDHVIAGTTTTLQQVLLPTDKLVIGEAYRFRVVATNQAGLSPSSGESNELVFATVPTTPTIVSAERGNRSITVTWDEPDFDGGEPITFYEASVTTTPSTPCTVAGDQRSCTITGLTNGTAYSVRVRARNTLTTTAWGATPAWGPYSDLVLNVKPAIAPVNAPAIQKARADGDGAALVSWTALSTAPTVTGGEPIDEYEVIAYAGGAEVASATFSGATTKEGRITGLTNGVRHTFRVLARNVVGDGPLSVETNTVTPAPVGTSCAHVLSQSYADSGVYLIDPDGDGGAEPFLAYCDMTTDGGGWTAVFAGLNGNLNGTALTFELASAASCTDPEGKCVRRAPATLDTDVEFAASCGDEMVKFRVTEPTLALLQTGARSGGWQPNSDVVALTPGAVPEFASHFYAGATSSDYGWILSQDSGSTSSANTFASSYTYRSTFRYCNGVLNTTNTVRLYYREAAPTTRAACDHVSGDFGSVCRSISDACPGSPTGTYWITPGAAGSAPVRAECDFDSDGGGWTRLTGSVAASLDGELAQQYRLVSGGRWYQSPSTTAAWSWTEGTEVTGVWSAFDGATEASFLCEGAAQKPAFGIGCSTGGAEAVLPSSNADPAQATATVCEGSPGVFAQACEDDVEVWVRGAPTRCGLSAAWAGRSCAAILEACPASASGRYWIDSTGGDPFDSFEAYCDMDTQGGGWMRVAKVAAEVPICSYAPGRGTVEEVAADGVASSTAILPAALVDPMPWTKEVLVVSGESTYVFRSTHANFTWNNIATGTVSASNPTSYSVQGSRDGVEFVNVASAASACRRLVGTTYYYCMFGGYHGSSANGWTPVLGAGAYWRSAYAQDATCENNASAASMKGLRIGGVWNQSGEVYIR